VGDIAIRDALTVLWRELRTAMLLGVALGVGGFVLAAVMHTSTSVALVLGTSMLAVVIWSATIGSVLPLAAVRVGIDPAIVSGPLLTTVVDATGLLIYFSIARLVLGI
jgi:magnesium transporter